MGVNSRCPRNATMPDAHQVSVLLLEIQHCPDSHHVKPLLIFTQLPRTGMHAAGNQVFLLKGDSHAAGTARPRSDVHG